MSPAMEDLFTAAGEAAVIALLERRPLLAFDFDGTLAAIVARPSAARVSARMAQRLHRLSQRLPVAIVTGRSVVDVRGRLGFAPQFIVGSHGAEDALDSAGSNACAQALAPLRQQLAGHAVALSRAGVTIEDKGQSIALHYRLAPDRLRAQLTIEAALQPPDPGLRLFLGKMVVNAVAADAPDKASAVHRLVARAGAEVALFAGDDVNDEPVFASAPADWLTLRVGRDDPASQARFAVDTQADLLRLLDALLLRLRA